MRPGSTCSSSTWRTATSSRASSRRSRTVAHGRVRRARSSAACATRSRSSTPCGPPGRRASRSRSRSRRRTGRRAARRPRTRSGSRAAPGARLRRHRPSRPGRRCRDQRPVYGRLYQTPFSDRIRHEAGVPTMTVGEPLHLRRRQLDPGRRPGGPVRARPRATCTIPTGRATPPGTRTTTSRGPTSTCPPRASRHGRARPRATGRRAASRALARRRRAPGAGGGGADRGDVLPEHLRGRRHGGADGEAHPERARTCRCSSTGSRSWGR